MEVIKNNDGFVHVCGSCKSILFIHKEDIDMIRDAMGKRFKATCVVCEKDTHIRENQVPNRWQLKFELKYL